MEAKYKKKAIMDRIEEIESDILKANEYLEDGSHAHWHKFKPVLKEKERNGETLPPHRDWVKNVFLPEREQALKEAIKLVDRLESKK
ncbi:hypothetical protein [Pleionea sp. CnH1-48]|uniref:hypothetical protein n=1 Tax=Pleionea sp. CnH1-48 TaxID=2954494 RepID=UPI002097DC5D|nr:hypothetical protein [Pleionea sp. CnH1-48]MCO7224726.1 hypothetical protein [Pleionea sp. CnH1-48]